MNLFHLHHFHLYLKQIKINYTDDTGISPMMEAINKGYNYIYSLCGSKTLSFFEEFFL